MGLREVVDRLLRRSVVDVMSEEVQEAREQLAADRERNRAIFEARVRGQATEAGHRVRNGR